ncbi:MAG TPA: hypothetical protein VFR47_25790 [Anaerolineales bacterium]|nr:hypothetical protein [Anaerolineales bacterium]
MHTFSRFIINFVALMILMGCSTANSTSNPIAVTTAPSELIPEFEGIEHSPTFTARPSSTPLPSAAPNLTQTEIFQAMASTQQAEQTMVASFSRVCKDNYDPRSFSPDGLWMVEYCSSEDDQSPILTFSNKDTNVIWKMVYRDYIQQGEFLPDGGLAVVHWSNDDRYVYFNSYVSGSGGECFVSGNVLNYGKGLFRLDLQTGITTAILPLRENFVGYDFSFSPTGRRMIYENNLGSLNILDLHSGQILNVVPVKQFRGAGGYLWSSDGLEFVYSTVLYNEISEPTAYSLRLVNAQSGGERILLESPENCFVAREWVESILKIESYDENYDRTLIEYDLNSEAVLSESTATPRP